MFDKKSEYALNKYDQDSIIYICFSALLLSIAIGRNRLAPVRSKGMNCLVFVEPAKIH